MSENNHPDRERINAIASLKAYKAILDDKNIEYSAMPSDDDLDVMPIGRIKMFIKTLRDLCRTPL